MVKTLSENMKEVNERFIEEATRAYLAALLWIGDHENGEPLDSMYDVHDFHPDSVAQARREVRHFIDTALEGIGPDAFDGLEGNEEFSHAERIGLDFALTRNGCGAGFWDRGIPHGDALSELCEVFGPADAYSDNVGDRGTLHIFPHRD